MYLSVDLLAGESSPGTATLRALIMAEKSSTGTITADTQLVQAVSGADYVGTLLGTGTKGHLCAKALFAEYPLATVDVVAPTESGGAAATGTFTFASGPPVKSWTVKAKICGRTIEITWAAGETDTAAATKLAAAINGQTLDLPVTAAGVLGVVTITAKTKGPWGNDITLSVQITDGTTGTCTASGAKCTGGTTEPAFTTALATVAGTEYDYIIPCTSNADAETASATSAPGRVKTHITTYQAGRRARLQQCVVGVSGAIADTKTGTGQHNFGPMVYQYAQGLLSLPCELAGAEVGARMKARSLRPNANRIEIPYVATLYPSADLTADALTDTELEDLLQYGVSPCSYDSSGGLQPARPITTYHKDSAGNADGRLLDVGQVDSIYDIAKDLRSSVAQEFKGSNLSKDLAPGAEPNPEGVVEERDVKSFINGRILFWVQRGVVVRDKYVKARDEGSFVVRVNPSDVSQCDIVLPLGIVPPLAKFSLVVQNVGAN